MASLTPPSESGEAKLSSPPSSISTSTHQKAFSLSSLNKPDVSAPEQTGKEGEKGKVRGLFGKLGPSKRKPSSGSLSISNDDKPIQSPPSTVTATPTPSTEQLKVKTAQSSTVTPSGTLAIPNDSDLFRQSLVSAQRAVDHLSSINTILTGVGAVTSLGAGWVPGLAQGVQLVLMMLDQAKTINVGKVAAIRLVERSAAVLAAVEQAVIDAHGVVFPSMEANIGQLLQNLHNTSYVLTKQVDRPFLKLYLHANDTAGQITKATEDLQDFIVMFQLQALISTSGWQEQSRLDHQHDLEVLVQKLDEGRKDDQAMLSLLQMKAEQQQEAMKTLQRTLDCLLAIQGHQHIEQYSTSSMSGPDSPARLDEGDAHPVPFIQMDSKQISAPKSIENRQLSQLDLTASLSRAQGPEEAGDMTASSIDTVQSHRDFCERALDVLRRTSSGTDTGVPDWTITSLEVSHEERISSGYFSVVWRGRWQKQAVAIKELSSTTDRTLFIKEVEVWRQLKDSVFILPFLGASSTTGPPPWFFVSPYMMNGSILNYLRSDAGIQSNKTALVHQMAQGMEYLHSRDILHGDFKAGNVLVTDVGQAIICDFGLSQLKLDISIRSRNEPAAQHAIAGTMRWQSPERLAGGRLTWQCDVYAFAIAVYEVFTGQVPFGYVDDNAVRTSIQKGDRPLRPQNVSDAMWTLVTLCWSQDPNDRPNFEDVSQRLAAMYKAPHSQATASTEMSESSIYITGTEDPVLDEQCAISPESNTLPVPDTQDSNSSLSESFQTLPADPENHLSFESDRAERYYRHYLGHDFDDRLTLPLWFPSAISLGSVGYVRHGQFIKLMDAHHPPLEIKELPPMPYLDEFSSLQTTKVPVNVRNAAERGLDMVNAFTHFIRTSGERSKKAVSRRISHPLRPGMKQASLVVDDGVFEIFKSFSEARAYLIVNIDWILHHFGDSHAIAKEDVIVVVGTLTAQNYAMIVSNFAPRTTLTFNVHAKPMLKEQWGTWSINSQPPNVDITKAFQSTTPPNSQAASRRPKSPKGVDEQDLKFTCKVSSISDSPMEAVLLAKLRFPPGGTDPSLYP